MVDADEVLRSVADSDEDIARGDAENLLTVFSGLLEDEVSAERLAEEIQLKPGRRDLKVRTSIEVHIDGLGADLNHFLNGFRSRVGLEAEVSDEADIHVWDGEGNGAARLSSEASWGDDEGSIAIGDGKSGIIGFPCSAAITEEDVHS